MLEEAKNFYQKIRDQEMKKIPEDEKELLKILEFAKEKSLMILKSSSLKSEALEFEILSEFSEFVSEDLDFMLRSNQNSSQTYNTNLIENLFKEIISNAEQGLYQEDLKKLEDD